ncbi:hypothetical protein AWENTII_000438 [Aspergillus wentii]
MAIYLSSLAILVQYMIRRNISSGLIYTNELPRPPHEKKKKKKKKKKKGKWKNGGPTKVDARIQPSCKMDAFQPHRLVFQLSLLHLDHYYSCGLRQGFRFPFPIIASSA